MLNEEMNSGFLGNVEPSISRFSEVQPIYMSKDGFAVCYKAKRDGKWFILKTLKPEFQDSMMVQKMWHKEFDYSYNCDHPNIVRTLGREYVGELGECIIQEYIDGITLKQFIVAGYVTHIRAIRIIRELCSALSYIHCKQIVHRDLHPDNIIITHNGSHVKLIDFGFADSNDYSVIKAPAGTQKYVSPEVLQGKLPDGRADIYAIGVLIYDMFRGAPKGVFKKIAKRCLLKDRESRYQFADEILIDLNGKSINQKILLYIAILVLILGVVAILSFKLPPIKQPTLHKQEVVAVENSKYDNNSTDFVKVDTIKVGEKKTDDSSEQVIELPYGRYEGMVLNGAPHGAGRLIYNCSHLINSKDSKLRYSEKGDIFVGRFYNGEPEYGKLYNSDNELKATMNFGRAK